jgi:hypothetical protein
MLWVAVNSVGTEKSHKILGVYRGVFYGQCSRNVIESKTLIVLLLTITKVEFWKMLRTPTIRIILIYDKINQQN